MIDEVISNPDYRKEYAERFLDLVHIGLFPDNPDIRELIFTLAKIDKLPPDNVSNEELLYIRSQFQYFISS